MPSSYFQRFRLHVLRLFASQAACALLNVISDESDCGPDASTYLLCVMSKMPGRIKIHVRGYKSFGNDIHQSL